MLRTAVPLRPTHVAILTLLTACHRTPGDSSARSEASGNRKSTASAADASETPGRMSVDEEIQMQERRRLATNDVCAAYLRAHGIARAGFPSGSAKIGGAKADAWKRPSAVRCELCGQPFRDGNAIVGRIAIVNEGASPVDVYLQSATHGPLWLDTVPPAPPTPTPVPLPEVFPAPLLWTIPAKSALDEWVQADVSADALQRGGTIVVRASVVFWNAGGLEPCGDAAVSL